MPPPPLQGALSEPLIKVRVLFCDPLFTFEVYYQNHGDNLPWDWNANYKQQRVYSPGCYARGFIGSWWRMKMSLNISTEEADSDEAAQIS